MTNVSKLVIQLLIVCYAYTFTMATTSVASCEISKPGQCSSQWTQCFTVVSGCISTLWAYITDSPIQSGRGSLTTRTKDNTNNDEEV